MQSDYAGFVKDLKTGAILGISNMRCLEEIAMNNQELVKRGEKRAIEFEVLSAIEGEKAYNDYVIEKLGKKLVGMPANEIIEEPIKRKSINK